MGDISIHSYLINHAQNEHKMIIMWPIFCQKACFYVFSHVTQWVRPDYDKKKIGKSAASAFFDQFYAENWSKYREIQIVQNKAKVSVDLFFLISIFGPIIPHFGWFFPHIKFWKHIKPCFIAKNG